MATGQLVESTSITLADNEIAALTLQVEDIHLHDETKKGKYKLDDVPDSEIAFASYLAEIEQHLRYLEDFKLAHSMGLAVSTDASVIDELVHAERQAHDDRQVAVAMVQQRDNFEVPRPYTEATRPVLVESDISNNPATYKDSDDESDTSAGPSGRYLRKQDDTFEKLAQKAFQCTACTDDFRYADVQRLQCGHLYCEKCLREFLMRGINDHDLTLIPPRCCGMPVPQEVIYRALSDVEKAEFRLSEVEKETRDKTYCSDSLCGKSILPQQIVAGNAKCPFCGVDTCALCKAPAHQDDCPADTALQATLDLGNDNQWQRCFSCHALVAIAWGCNHMTCRCGAEFCYRCGIEWTTPRRCGCDFWMEANLVRRAEQIVDREAPHGPQPANRHRRIAEVQARLRDNDDCNHRGRNLRELLVALGSDSNARCVTKDIDNSSFDAVGVHWMCAWTVACIASDLNAEVYAQFQTRQWIKS